MKLDFKIEDKAENTIKAKPSLRVDADGSLWVNIDGHDAINIETDGVIKMRVWNESYGYNEIAKLKNKADFGGDDWFVDRIDKE